ncbi:hypothetical protein RhiLY_07796 [Ceratobasidium sp. AG-Ba]|nr:hypothetical protein RhiLY_07796 [Ceratobasidium sp. AG-Ba]
MAPTRSNKSAKATSVRYDPRDAQVTVDNTPKSVWGKQRLSHKLTWGHGGDRMYSYQDAIRRCDSFIQSSDFAKTLDPSLILDYIPMAERWNCRWLATHTLQCPKRAICIGMVGSEVEHLVKEVQKVKKMSCTPHLIKRLEEWENQGRSKAVPKWVENSTEWWFRLSDIEDMKREWMMSLGDKGQKMAIVAKGPEGNILRGSSRASGEGKMVKEGIIGLAGPEAWDKGNEDLSVDMADLLLEPLDEDEEWVKLKEEVWGAEAPNGAKVYHPKDTEEF